MRGYRQALADHGIAFNPALIDEGPAGEDARRRLLLASGEEYVQLVAVPAAEAAGWTSDPAGTASVVGEIRPGEEGIRLRTAAGDLEPLPRLGWEHTF